MEENQHLLPWRVPPQGGTHIRVWGSAPHAAVVTVQAGRLSVSFTGDPDDDWVIAERITRIATPAPRTALASHILIGGTPPPGWDGAERYGVWIAQAAERAIAYLRQAHVPPALLDVALTRRTLRSAHMAWTQIARWGGTLRPRRELALCASMHAYPVMVARMLGWQAEPPPPPRCDIHRIGALLWSSAGAPPMARGGGG